MKSLDLEYHNVDPQAGLYHGMAEEGGAPCFTTNDLVELAKRQPPRNTRAFGRSEIICHVVKEGWADFLEQAGGHHDPRRPPYVSNWSVLQLQGSPAFVMRSYVQESRDYCAEWSSRPSLEPLSNKQDS
ncbi:MAG: proteasome accessory factor PafA2 family protein [Nitrospirota bacterium]|nr:proteasome accessory factor PafA2 family protein [Nitrospirota bacterium]MDH5700078.1 proteasome accessory factor PafA2 family protein [Nitrospirota bacterium]